MVRVINLVMKNTNASTLKTISKTVVVVLLKTLLCPEPLVTWPTLRLGIVLLSPTLLPSDALLASVLFPSVIQVSPLFLDLAETTAPETNKNH